MSGSTQKFTGIRLCEAAEIFGTGEPEARIVLNFFEVHFEKDKGLNTKRAFHLYDEASVIAIQVMRSNFGRQKVN